MKVRMGFVSNSSSSSFTIFGIRLNEDEVRDLVGPLQPDEDYNAALTEKADECGLACYETEYDVYVGCEWRLMNDNQTAKQFKQSIKDDIEKLCVALQSLHCYWLSCSTWTDCEDY